MPELDKPSLNSELVFDIGLHDGADTAYYLSKGYRVVAVDANPIMVEQARKIFHKQITSGQLEILNVGIASTEGSLDFWICDTVTQWSSFHKNIASRDGAKHHKIQVKTTRFEDILAKYGIPDFTKIDIEGNDRLCLEAIDPDNAPTYVSAEGGKKLDLLEILRDKGYDRFKLISQFNFLPIELSPTREERIFKARALLRKNTILARACRKIFGEVNYRRFAHPTAFDGEWHFKRGSSGPIPNDTSGSWRSFSEIVEIYEKIHNDITSGQKSIFWGESDYSFWHDIHAVHSSARSC